LTERTRHYRVHNLEPRQLVSQDGLSATSQTTERDNELELVVEVDADKANASIKSVNIGLSGMEQAAVQAARLSTRS